MDPDPITNDKQDEQSNGQEGKQRKYTIGFVMVLLMTIGVLMISVYLTTGKISSGKVECC